MKRRVDFWVSDKWGKWCFVKYLAEFWEKVDSITFFIMGEERFTLIFNDLNGDLKHILEPLEKADKVEVEVFIEGSKPSETQGV